MKVLLSGFYGMLNLIGMKYACFLEQLTQYFVHDKQAFDLDHSGKIDFTEFLIAISLSSEGNVEKKLKLAFQMYDASMILLIFNNQLFEFLIELV